jgi:hypothetical protein
VGRDQGSGLSVFSLLQDLIPEHDSEKPGKPPVSISIRMMAIGKRVASDQNFRSERATKKEPNSGTPDS